VESAEIHGYLDVHIVKEFGSLNIVSEHVYNIKDIPDNWHTPGAAAPIVEGRVAAVESLKFDDNIMGGVKVARQFREPDPCKKESSNHSPMEMDRKYKAHQANS
jgi:hypothetical protein